MMRRLAAILVIASFACLIPGANARAGSSTLAFADTGGGMADGDPTGDIFSAKTLTIGDLVSSKSGGTGSLSGFASEDFGSVSFGTTPGANSSLSFSSSDFGSFTSTNLTVQSVSATSITFYILGNYTGG